LARPDFRAAAARRLSEERELSPAIISLLSSDAPSRPGGIRHLPLDRLVPNPEQPRVTFIQETIDELAASIRERGVLQPVLVRPHGAGHFQIVAGERRWRASQRAGLTTIPAMIEDIDDETAIEIAIIENLQREDLSPLDEATMYDKMIRQHGYSIRKLAEKLGKDKGYLENRLRLADAPPEVRELVSLRKDTLSHAYELLKISDPRKRRRLAEQVARGELSLVKLRERVEGRRTQPVATRVTEDEPPAPAAAPAIDAAADGTDAWTGARSGAPLTDESLVAAKQGLVDAIEELVGVLHAPTVMDSIGPTDRANLAKYLTIAKLRLENVIAMVRSGEPRE
jgi:ParB family chromosome partitioning protein